MSGRVTAQKKRYEISRRSVADAQTPFVRNCWYVAARSEEIGQSLSSRLLLGESVLFFRREDGTAVALSNRCPHRSYPLDKGRLEGDDVVCGYHGLRYGSDGLCKAIPGRSGGATAFGVKSYPLIEAGSFIWIWMGDPEAAEQVPSPVPEWLGHPDWSVETGYLHVDGSYVHMHENLLDLSHLSYLHASSFGTPEYAAAPTEVSIEDDDIQVWRHVECVLPDLYAVPLGWRGERAMRRSGSQFVSPALHVNTGLFENLDRPDASVRRPTVKVAQLLTPETQTTMHYFYALCRNFAVDDAAVGAGMIAGMTKAFQEDQAAMAEISAQHATARSDEFYEFDIPTDRAGLEMRRLLKEMADEEMRSANA
ncbi:MAG: Rieske 2Fe-2S domain-containing protein [Sphingomonadaceae bacterium]|nr:Rieske 2Fe-2S domain-containing protein [Sphingomonadaceae bacterium]